VVGRLVRKMRRLSARNLEAEVSHEAASLALCVWGQLGQVAEKAPGVVLVVMRDAVGGGAHRGVRKTGVEGQWELARVEHRHGPGVRKMRRLSARHLEAEVRQEAASLALCVWGQLGQEVASC
jgi:hypothetical protein